jgi:hypothetical protein
VERLHAGDDTELCEAGNVRGGDGFDVLDAIAVVPGVIRVFGEFVSVERCANGVIADGVGVELKAFLVECGDGGFVFFGIPEQRALGGRIVGVRFEERGGVGLDYAVEIKLDAVCVDPFIVKLFPGRFEGVEILWVHFGGIENVGDVEAKGELIFVAEFLPSPF